MGCDIHIWVEVRKSWGEWWKVASLECERQYTVFNQLAGVRPYDDEPPCIFPPRGLPAGVDTYIASESEGLHGLSWLTPDEWKAALSRTHACPDFWAVHNYATTLEEESRIVFGFDS